MEVDGVDVNTNVYSGKLRVALGQVVGDNLGVYGLLGFTESFSANYPCRHCKAHKTVVRTQCVADPELRRNEQNYADDVALNSLPDTGIKKKNASLMSFKSFMSLTIMHLMLCMTF